MNSSFFPTWRYHRTKPAVIVHDAAELKALGPGWADTPAAFEAAAEAEKKPAKGKNKTEKAAE